MSKPSQLKEPKSKSNKSEQIIAGAMEQFLKHGYAGASMDRIAAAAGVSKQTLYSYFEDKDSLFTTLVEQITKRRFQLVFGLQPLEGEPNLVLRNLANNILQQIRNDRDYHNFIRLIVSESGRFPELGKTMIRNVTQPGMQALSNYLASHPELNITDPEETAGIFIGAIVFFVLTQEILHGKEVMPRSSDRLIDSLIHSIVNVRN